MLKVSAWTYFSFFIYLLFMLGIGIYFFYRTRTLSDYVLGGRTLGAWVTAMSAYASDMSGWLLMGLPGLAFATGLSEPFWCALGLVIGSCLNWVFVARRLRNFTEVTGNALTLSEYFERRFEDKTKSLRLLSSFFVIFFFTIYISAQFVAGAKLFETILGFPYWSGLLLMALSLTFYIFLGGYLAVCWTDFFQGMLMFFALIIVPLVALKALGLGYILGLGYDGGGGLPSAAAWLSSEVSSSYFHFFSKADGTLMGGLAIVSLLAWGLGYFGQPHILVRFMGIDQSRMLKKATIIAVTWTFVSMAMAIAVGLVGIFFVKRFGAYQGFEPERIFILLINATMNPFIGGFMLAAILAAAQSTAASQLLVTSSSFVEDILRVFCPEKTKKLEDKTLVKINRASVIGVMLIAVVVASDPNSSVLKIVAYAWGGLGAAFGPLIALSLYWPRMTRNGALAGLIVGGITTIVWKNFMSPLGGFWGMYEIIPGVVFSTLGIIMVSLLDSRPSKEILHLFKKAINAGV